ncbi:MAG: transposase [Planctomycetes bacterium]|nr:transposase [Planctomycetota bacterium]
MRLSDQRAADAKRMQCIGTDDWLVQFQPSQAIYRKHPDLPKVLTARLLRYAFPGFRPSWLLTSLTDDQEFTHSELVNLYHRRWQIETLYREWKHTLDIQNLRSHTPPGLFKEIYAQLLLNNLIRWTMTEAAEPTTLDAVDFSFVATVSHIKNALLQMLRASPGQIKLIYQILLMDVRSCRIRKRPGRSYPRPGDKPRNRGNGKTRTSARIQNP